MQASPETIRIFVQDEGSTEIYFSGLIEPFKRGQNAAHRQGVGLGLTIVGSIAEFQIRR